MGIKWMMVVGEERCWLFLEQSMTEESVTSTTTAAIIRLGNCLFAFEPNVVVKRKEATLAKKGELNPIIG